MQHGRMILYRLCVSQKRAKQTCRVGPVVPQYIRIGGREGILSLDKPHPLDPRNYLNYLACCNGCHALYLTPTRLPSSGREPFFGSPLVFTDVPPPVPPQPAAVGVGGDRARDPHEGALIPRVGVGPLERPHHVGGRPIREGGPAPARAVAPVLAVQGLVRPDPLRQLLLLRRREGLHLHRGTPPQALGGRLVEGAQHLLQGVR